MNSRFHSLLAALVVAVSVPAMAASPSSRADKAAEGMLKLDETLKEGQGQLDAATNSLNALTGAQGSDLVKKYKEFSKQVAKTESMGKTVRSKSKDAASKREQYLKAWEQDQGKIQNEQLKAAAEARRQELLPTIDQVKTSLASAGESFGPFMQNLKDLDLFLGNDLSQAGLTAAADLIGKCNGSAAKVKTDLDQASEGMRALHARITPGGAQK